MNWYKSISEIRKQQQNNQLVVFVGAGISKNSGLPSWGELIEKIAKEIDYYHKNQCIDCKLRSPVCPKGTATASCDYSQDEFLRIPEYFYQMDNSKDHKRYYQFIVDSLESEGTSNPIDDEIFNLLPHHIITTNYDSLLEGSNNHLSKLYTVVTEDSDLLSEASDRYIIKMHGDLASPRTIVLKESDYIDYEQKHPLISTFIRSLLINHTFVFLGYSLNDYNLNLIIGWINYFQKIHNVIKRPKSYLIDCKMPSKHETIRQESKNIFIVDISEIPDDIVQKANPPSCLTTSIGQHHYAYLRALTSPDFLEQFIPLSDTLKEKYAALDCYRRISHYDLIKSQHLGRISFESTALVFYDKNWFDNYAKLVEANDQNVVHILQKAGITELRYFPNESPLLIPEVDYYGDHNFSLYLDNDYIALQKSAHDCIEHAEKAYYLYITGTSSQEVFSAIEESYLDLPKKNYYISLLICKIRERIIKLTSFNRQKELTAEINQIFVTCPKQYENAVGFLRMIHNSTANQALEMQELLDKQEKRNKYGRTGWESGHAFTHIWKLQAIAYDYYFFIKKNFLPLDYFTDSKKYLSYYIQAILCSYSPIETSTSTDFFDLPTHHQHYTLTDIDLDIIVKFSDPKLLSSWLKKYNVEILEIDKSVNIARKYENLCNSFVSLSIKYLPDYIRNLTVVIFTSGVNSGIKDHTVSIFVDSFISASKKDLNLCIKLLATLDFLVQNATDHFTLDFKNRILKTILDEKNYNTLLAEPSSTIRKVVRIFAPFVEQKIVEQQLEYIEKQETIQKKLALIYDRRFLLPINKYQNLIEENITNISSDQVFHLLVEKRIRFTPDIQAHFVDTIKKEHEKRIAQPGQRSYPDWLQITLDECIILRILGYNFDISILQPYKEYSLYLQFILDPETFDYSQINTKEYMWQNLLFSTEYGELLKKHKEEILTPELKRIFKMGLETRDQQKIVYGVLLDQDELGKF